MRSSSTIKTRSAFDDGATGRPVEGAIVTCSTAAATRA
jgi:hypothetical protein